MHYVFTIGRIVQFVSMMARVSVGFWGLCCFHPAQNGLKKAEQNGVIPCFTGLC
jgi:hypothetical protein